MPRIEITANELVVHLSPVEQLASLTSEVKVGPKQILGAWAGPNFANARAVFKEIGMRAPGTGIPGYFAAGTYRKLGKKTFTYWKSGQQVLMVNLTGHKFDRLALGVQDAQALADEINSLITAC